MEIGANLREAEEESPLAVNWQVLHQRALEIAWGVHGAQRDKAGNPMMDHVLRVAFAAGHYEDTILALLHDILEDSVFMLSTLKLQGFPASLLVALDALTRQKQETYWHYIHRVAANPAAVRVKLLDLKDNMDITRFLFFPDVKLSLLRRYHEAYIFLSQQPFSLDKP